MLLASDLLLLRILVLVLLVRQSAHISGGSRPLTWLQCPASRHLCVCGIRRILDLDLDLDLELSCIFQEVRVWRS